MAWQRLGAIAPEALVAARQQAHFAAQVISAAGETFLPHLPDTSHTAMAWDPLHAALAGRELPGAGCRVALRVGDLGLLLLTGDGAIAAHTPLAGLTLPEAYRWTSDAVKSRTRGALARELVHPGYELDPHPIAGGARFALDPGLPELARWFANADLELQGITRGTPGAGEVLCWPHHFDIAALVVLERDAAGDPLRTLGAGLSPGDEFASEPYWYVNHGPETQHADLPPLAGGGEWLREGTTFAVLRGSRVAAAGGAAEQHARSRTFLASAIAASRKLALEAEVG
jgi:hypothetical protein